VSDSTHLGNVIGHLHLGEQDGLGELQRVDGQSHLLRARFSLFQLLDRLLVMVALNQVVNFVEVLLHPGAELKRMSRVCVQSCDNLLAIRCALNDRVERNQTALGCCEADQLADELRTEELERRANFLASILVVDIDKDEVEFSSEAI